MSKSTNPVIALRSGADHLPRRARVNAPRVPRILLVEDSVPVRWRLRSLIEESCAARVMGEASTIVGARALFREYQPDAVVLDLQLADGNATALLREIKTARPACVVIVLTNFDNSESRELCRRAGADHFFRKSREFERVPAVLSKLNQTLFPDFPHNSSTENS